MRITKRNLDDKEIALVNSDEILISNVQSALDLMATITYETGCALMIINKEAISEEFFDLKTKIAGDILQKFVNYKFRIAIVGDFSGYTSKSLRDFICESNRGRDIFFLPDQEQAVEKLTCA